MISFTNQNSLNNCVLTADIVDVIDIQIVDEANNFIDFNGIDWTMTLGISIERERKVKFDSNLMDAIQSLLKKPDIGNSQQVKIDPELQLLES
jgi:hypothetical protein